MISSMEITGSHTITAGSLQVFQALLNPVALKESIPGCSAAEYTEVAWAPGQYIKLTISPSFPGLSGTYDVYVKPEEVVEPSHLVLVSTPSSAIGSINARCVVDLVADGANTTVNYATTATLEGKLAATPEFVVKPAVKGFLDRFFKNLEKYV
jgi:carbon monoxide dehydrogenase subunit G